MVAVASASPVGHLILDRDGVLNRETAGGWTTSPSEWTWEHGSLRALDLLATVDVAISIVTNQSCIGRGVSTAAEVDELHRWLVAHIERRGVRVSGVFVCPHAPWDECACRKPRPALVLEAIRASGVEPGRTVMVGDSDIDAVAGQAAGITSISVRTGKAETGGPAAMVVDDVHDAVLACLDRAVDTGQDADE